MEGTLDLFNKANHGGFHGFTLGLPRREMKPDIGQNIPQLRVQSQHRRLSGFGHKRLNAMLMKWIHRQQSLSQLYPLGMLFKERPLHRLPLLHHGNGIRPTGHFVNPDPPRIEF